jgi:hypothetical protein
MLVNQLKSDINQRIAKLNLHRKVATNLFNKKDNDHHIKYLDKSIEEHRNMLSKMSSEADSDLADLKSIELDKENKKEIMENGMYLRKNLHKWLALQKFNFSGKEVTLLGLLNNTVESVTSGEELRSAKERWYGTSSGTPIKDIFSIPGRLLITAANFVMEFDKELTSGKFDKFFGKLLPEKYKDPEIFHDEFHRHPYSIFRRTYNP